MRRWNALLAALALAVGMLLTMTPGAAAQSEDEVAEMRAAMPDKPRVTPEKPRKLLIFSLCRGFVHSSVPYGAKALLLMGEMTGAYTAVESTDISVFEPETLNQFDAVLFNNSTGELFLPPNMSDLSQEEQQKARERDARLKASLLDFVRSGKGVIGVHAATDCFYNWTEYGEMMGGYFSGHPWNEDVAVKLDDPAHPVNRAFKGQGFTIADEIYQFKEPYSREKLRVLLSLDTSKTNMKKDGIRREDDDFAVSWVRDFGQGRVFYCSLGHRHEIFWTPAVLQHYLDGIQFALGDLAADATPSAQLPGDYAAKAMTAVQAELIDEAIAELPAYTLGEDPASLRFLENAVNDTYGRAKERRALARKLAAVLSDPKATFYAKRFVCRQLYHLGVPQVVSAVAPLLSDPECAEIARYALERMDAPSVDQAYLDALPKASGAVKIGLINGLGERKSAVAVDALLDLAGDADSDTARAAILALGKIGGARTAEVLAKLQDSFSGDLAPVCLDARLLCADRFLAEGQTGNAQAIYDDVYRSEYPDRFRVAALRGIVQAQGDDAIVVVLDALRQDNAAIREAAAAVVRDVSGGTATHVFASELPNLPPDTQELLLISLAERADPAALGAVAQAVSSEVEGVRNAALEAMAVLGNANSAVLLTETAATSDGQTQELARRALNRMRGLDINAALVDLLENSPEAAQRVEAARALGERLASDTTTALLKAAAMDTSAGVRIAALDALATMAQPEALPEIVEVVVEAPDDETRNAAENAAIVVGARAEKDADRSQAVVAAFAHMSTSSVAKAALLRILGQFGDETALPTVTAAADARDDEVRATALRVLSDWPNAAPMDALLRLAKSASSETDRIIALRGYLRMIEMPSERDAQETLGLYRNAAELAATTEEKKLVLSGLGKMGHRSAMELIRPYLEDKDVQEEAKLAAQAVQSAAYKTSASVASDASSNAIDGNIDTRWATGGKQQPGQWFMLDLGWPETVKQITLDATKSPNDFPRGYEVYISSNTDDWGDPVAKGEGKEAITVINCRNSKGRYIRIVQTGATDVWFWSIHELKVEAE